MTIFAVSRASGEGSRGCLLLDVGLATEYEMARECREASASRVERSVADLDVAVAGVGAALPAARPGEGRAVEADMGEEADELRDSRSCIRAKTPAESAAGLAALLAALVRLVPVVRERQTDRYGH